MTAVAVERRAPGGLVGWLASTDHKRIGLLTLASSAVFFAASGALALLIRTELLSPGLDVLSKDSYNQVFTMHGAGMIYLVVTPLALGLGVYLVPLQIGAAGLAGARLALLGFWLYALGGLATYAGFATTDGAGKDGWFATYPLSSEANTPGVGMHLWVAGVVLAVGGMTAVGATVLWTLYRRRAPGMTMLRLPVFAWTQVATCLLVVMSFPVLVVALALLEIERVTGLDVYSRLGNGPIAYQHLFWFYGHPVVYVMFFPFVGAVGEVIATFARRRFFAYSGFGLSLLLFAALSMAVWAHHMFATGQVANGYFSLTSTLLAIPAGLEYFALVGTLVGGRIVFSTAMLFALGFLLQFLVGGLSGIFVASPPLDYHVTDSYFVVAHFHYTLFAGSLFGLFAGVYYWFPKLTGALLREGLGRVHFALLVAGTNLTFFPMFVLGERGMPRRVAVYAPELAGLNRLASAGAYLIALALLVFAANVAVSLRRRREAGPDPWQGHTLEWAADSPPARWNFRELPPIRSHAPLLDLREGRAP